jgi:hypothetical protein
MSVLVGVATMVYRRKRTTPTRQFVPLQFTESDMEGGMISGSEEVDGLIE